MVTLPKRHRRFLLACLFELLLLGLALVSLRLFRSLPTLKFTWSVRDLLVAVFAVLPMLGMFGWVLRSRLGPVAEVREFLEKVVVHFFAGWPLPQLALLCLIAGISEESLFRVVVQGGFAQMVGPAWAIVLAGFVFGLCHFINWTYAVLAALIGMYLGWLWLVTGNLLAPAATHALYDFVALIYLVRTQHPEQQGAP